MNAPSEIYEFGEFRVDAGKRLLTKRGRNVPLAQVIGWLCSLAPNGVIEFVRKDDPTIQQMLALREDIFIDYTQDQFERLLASNARIIRSQTVSSAGRTLYWYARS